MIEKSTTGGFNDGDHESADTRTIEELRRFMIRMGTIDVPTI